MSFEVELLSLPYNNLPLYYSLQLLAGRWFKNMLKKIVPQNVRFQIDPSNSRKTYRPEVKRNTDTKRKCDRTVKRLSKWHYN
jgi:hypothetical protein